MNKKITVIGSLNYDVILKIPRLPFKGETLTANGATFSAGGKGANQAVQAAKLKTPTYMVGCVGTDASADFLVNTAKEYGVNVDYIRKVPGSSGMGVINAVEDGSVYACIVRGANFEVTKEDVDNAMPILKESGVCILQNEIPVEIIAYAIDKAKEALKLYFAAFIFMDLQYIGQTVFKSLNKKKQAIFFSLLRKVFIVVPLTYLFPYTFHMGTRGVFLAEPISNVIGGSLCFITMLAIVMPELKRMKENYK